jgi:hypothetical protein
MRPNNWKNTGGIIMQTLEQQLQRFKLEMEGNSSGGLLLYVPELKQFVRISYGTGDNLSSEDIEEGYDDYLYIVIDEFDDGWEEDIDGGQMLLKMKEEWGHYNICQHIKDGLEFMGITEDVVVLQSFHH